MADRKDEKQKDNSGFLLKVALRERAVKIARDLCGGSPFVMETHGGVGRLYDVLYGIQGLRGVVFEKKQEKIAALARQRPTWAVYEADCEKAIASGVGSVWTVDLLDLDLYGDPWPAITAFMESDRTFSDCMVVVVTDGLRQKVRFGGAWQTGSLRMAVLKIGNNNMFNDYLKFCEVNMDEIATKAGYLVDRFAGYHCGHGGSMTHYLAVLVKGSDPSLPVGLS